MPVNMDLLSYDDYTLYYTTRGGMLSTRGKVLVLADETYIALLPGATYISEPPVPTEDYTLMLGGEILIAAVNSLERPEQWPRGARIKGKQITSRQLWRWWYAQERVFCETKDQGQGAYISW